MLLLLQALRFQHLLDLTDIITPQIYIFNISGKLFQIEMQSIINNIVTDIPPACRCAADLWMHLNLLTFQMWPKITEEVGLARKVWRWCSTAFALACIIYIYIVPALWQHDGGISKWRREEDRLHQLKEEMQRHHLVQNKHTPSSLPARRMVSWYTSFMLLEESIAEYQPQMSPEAPCWSLVWKKCAQTSNKKATSLIDYSIWGFTPTQKTN